MEWVKWKSVKGFLIKSKTFEAANILNNAVCFTKSDFKGPA